MGKLVPLTLKLLMLCIVESRFIEFVDKNELFRSILRAESKREVRAVVWSLKRGITGPELSILCIEEAKFGEQHSCVLGEVKNLVRQRSCILRLQPLQFTRISLDRIRCLHCAQLVMVTVIIEITALYKHDSINSHYSH